MKQIALHRKHREPSKFAGPYGEAPLSANNLQWNVTEGKHDVNGESLRIVQNEVYAYWASEDKEARDAWWTSADYPNTWFGFDANDWSWADVEKQLTLIQVELAKNPTAAPGTIQHFNTMMAQNAATKKFMVTDPETQVAPVAPEGEVTPVATDAENIPPTMSATYALIAGGLGLTVIGLLVALFMKKKK